MKCQKITNNEVDRYIESNAIIQADRLEREKKGMLILT